MVGIVGPSGSGKSTLMDILAGLLPVKYGSLTVDGHIIDGAMAKLWRRSIGYVSQDVVLRDDTILNNVIGSADDPCLDEAWLEEVAALAGLKEELEQDLPRGWDTRVGERGLGLSGGQRQRVAIARALYHRPALLLLDEATSALDSKTEQTILETLTELKGYVTIVFVTHRPDTLSSCDVVYRIHDGILSPEASTLTHDEIKAKTSLPNG